MKETSIDKEGNTLVMHFTISDNKVYLNNSATYVTLPNLIMLYTVI